MNKLLIIALIIFMGLSGVAFGQSGLDLSSDTIPKGFKGDDIIGVVKALSKTVTGRGNRPSPPVNISDKKDIDRVYIFKLSDDKVYSSPAGVWIETSTKGISPRYKREYQAALVYPGIPEEFYLIKDMGSKVKKWTGQNVFGARVGAETTTEVQYFVSPAQGNIGKLRGIPEGSKIGVLFIGKPYNKGDGYVFYPGLGDTATFDMPYATVRKFYSVRLDLQEVWVYDQDSGKVLLKQKVEKQAEPEPAKKIRPPAGPLPLRPPPPQPPIRGY